MNFISIKENEMINADKIVSIKVQTIKGSKKLVLFTENRSYTVDSSETDVLNILFKSGVNLTEQFTSV